MEQYTKGRNWKYYLRSSFETFVAGFAAELLLNIDQINMDTIQDGAWLGFVFLATRSGIKMLLISVVEAKK